jgi:histone H3/H4
MDFKSSVRIVASRALQEDGIDLSEEAINLLSICAGKLASSVVSDSLLVASSTGRNSISGEDFISSLRAFGYENYSIPLEIYLSKYHTHIMICEFCSGKRKEQVVEKAANEIDVHLSKRRKSVKSIEDVKPEPKAAAISKNIKDKKKAKNEEMNHSKKGKRKFQLSPEQIQAILTEHFELAINNQKPVAILAKVAKDISFPLELILKKFQE